MTTEAVKQMATPIDNPVPPDHATYPHAGWVDFDTTSGPTPDLIAVFGDLKREASEQGAGFTADLGWSQDEAAAVRAQLSTFAEDWDAPGMNAYDAL